MSVELADNPSIDPCEELGDELAAWAENLIESHNVYLRNSKQQIVDQHRHQNRDHHTDDEQNGDQQNRDQKNDDQQNKDDNKVNQHVGNQQNGDQPASPDDNDQSDFKDGDATMAVNTAANEISNATNNAYEHEGPAQLCGGTSNSSAKQGSEE